MHRLLIVNGEVVTPSKVVNGALLVEGTRISEIFAHTVKTSSEKVLDAEGGFILPGLIDLHSDALEKEINPRPQTDIPLDWAIINLDRKFAGWGITSVYHAIMFTEEIETQRSIGGAVERVGRIVSLQRNQELLVNHFIHARCDLGDTNGTESICRLIDEDKVNYVSLTEHVPGRGQFAKNPEALRAYYLDRYGLDQKSVDQLLRSKVEGTKVANANAERVSRKAKERGIILASHDDDSVEKVDHGYHHFGVGISEFPVNVRVAERARELGLRVCMGAPNVVTGKSMSGNVSALETISKGLTDMLCSDYHVPSMLYAIFNLFERGHLGLNDAVNIVSLNPAKAMNKSHLLGSIEEGKQADLVIVKKIHDIPVVIRTIVEGRIVYESTY